MAKKLINWITKDEYEKILKYTLAQKKKNSKKLALAIMLAFEAGLRISEIVGYLDKVPALTKDRVSIKEHTILVKSGKGEKDRMVPLPRRFNNAALKLLPIKLHRRTLEYHVKKVAKKVLEKDICFHSLRHGFGSHLAGANRPVHEIQVLMGHSKLETTAIYLHANPKKAMEGARDVF